MYEGNICEDCVSEQKQNLEKNINKTFYYIIISLSLAFVFNLYIYWESLFSSNSNLLEITGAIFFFTVWLGAIPSGWRVLSKLPITKKGTYISGIGLIFIWIFKFFVGYFIGPFALIYEMYQIVKHKIKN